MKISVIISVYNGENLLKRAIESVITQTIGFENIELIIVDNNSTDKTRGIIKCYTEKYENINHIFREKNSGSPSVPRNNGIDAAQGKYIMFLDHDDEYNSGICEHLLNGIEKFNTNFAECWYRLKEENKNIETKSCHKDLYVVHSYKHDNDFSFMSGVHWNRIYKKSFLDKYNIRFPENIYAEDIYFSSLCYSNVNKWIEVKYIGYFHIIYSDSESSLRKKFHIGVYKGLKLTYNTLKKENSDFLQFPLQQMPACALLFLRLGFSYSESKDILNNYWDLYKLYDTYENLSKGMYVFMKIFTFKKSIAILIASIYNLLKIDKILRNKHIMKIVRKIANLPDYNWGE